MYTNVFYQWRCRQGLCGFDSPEAEWRPRAYQRLHLIEIVTQVVFKFVFKLSFKCRNSISPTIYNIYTQNERPVFKGEANEKKTLHEADTESA